MIDFEGLFFDFDFEENYAQTLKLHNTIIGYESELDSDDDTPTKFLDQQNIAQVSTDTDGNGDNRHESMFCQSFQFIGGEKKNI